MLIEEGGDGVASRIPDTLQALIAARIDRLPAEARRVLRRASVVGRVFWAGAFVDLSEELDDVPDLFDELVLRDFLIREERSTISGEVAYRFKHVLIREVAYGGLTKAARAALHRRFAGWLRERAGDELLEIRAYHLDHAVSPRGGAGRRPVERSRDRRRAGAGEGRQARARAGGEPHRRGSAATRGRAGADARAALPPRPRLPGA